MSSIDDNIKVSLSEKQKQIIKNHLNDNGKLSCIKAFKVARLIDVEPFAISAITKSLNIRTTDCELGVFGNLEFSNKDENIYNDLVQQYEKEKKLDCKVYWDEAKKSSLHKVGSTVKNSDFEVINCQLGCFRLKESKGDKNGSKS